MDTINFSYNWNKKLDCKAFTTFRIDRWNSKDGFYYEVGKEYIIEGKNIQSFIARCVDKRVLTLSQCNEFIARLDTGYSLAEFKEIVRKMYKTADKEKFAFILLVKEEK